MVDKRQMKLLSFIYKKPRTQTEINNKFKIDETEFDDYYFCHKEMKNLIEDDLPDDNWDRVIYITPQGRRTVEDNRQAFRTTLFQWITTLIAVSAFIKSFFF